MVDQAPPYPPQQGGYPAYPPQQGYPPQQAYPPPQQGYAGGPPPYNQPPPAQTSTTTSNVVVVQQQPQVVHTTVYTRHYGANDHGLLYAIIASCIVFWCIGWAGLFCTIPAIFVAINAQNHESAGNLEGMRQNQNLSMILSTVGLIVCFASVFLWIILGAVA